MANKEQFIKFQEDTGNQEALSVRSYREKEKIAQEQRVKKLTEKIIQEANKIADEELPIVQRYASEKDKLYFKQVLVAQRLALEIND